MDTVITFIKQGNGFVTAWYQQLQLNGMDIVLIGSLIASWGALILALMAIKRMKMQNTSTQSLCEKLVHDLHIASSGAIGMGQRIIAMEKKLTQAPVSMPATQQKPVSNFSRVKPLTATKPAIKPVKLAAARGNNRVNNNVTTNTSEDLPQEVNSFEVAKGLLRRGVDQSEVARRCGLSISETALMAMVMNNRGNQTARLAG